ncbi:hypothetical protein NX862_04660 [Rhodobacter sp. KR11]|uniref:hypothetical protein n=1 Tax=Rhodobacter sp. KR11 TaxID=2974588 RepID=UPI0022229921|nr:hypothetical protein [Rhodobacter sp. KR11]MCW1918036.1 hypothetical protein [Rhodobacter sp. KR11]
MEKLEWMRDVLTRMEIDATKRGWIEMIEQINATRRVLTAEAALHGQPENVIRVDFRSVRSTRHPQISVFP